MTTDTKKPTKADDVALEQEAESAGGDTEHLKPVYTNTLVGEEEESDEG